MINKDVEYLNSLGYRGPRGRKHPEETQIEWDTEYKLKKPTPDKNGCFSIEFWERTIGDNSYFVYTIKIYYPYKNTNKRICCKIEMLSSDELCDIPKLEAELFGLVYNGLQIQPV